MSWDQRRAKPFSAAAAAIIEFVDRAGYNSSANSRPSSCVSSVTRDVEEFLHQRQKLARLAPALSQFAAHDIGGFVQNLHADAPARRTSAKSLRVISFFRSERR